MPAMALLLVLAQARAPGTPPAPAAAASADVVVERSLALGIDFAPSPLGRSRAKKKDIAALKKAAPGTWLDAQIQVANDSIAEPPAALRDYLEAHKETLWAIVSALEKGPPEWKARSSKEDIPSLMPWIRLHKVLLATALCEEREGRAVEARRALEASWSLGRGFPGPNVLIARILGVAVESWQAGALRKFAAPPLPWIARLADDEPWRRIVEAIAAEGGLAVRGTSSPEEDPTRVVRARAIVAVSRALPGISPCDREALTDDIIWRPGAAVFAVESSSEARASEPILKETIQGSIASMVRRTARLRVDRELTSRIVELRLQKSASREQKWPEGGEIPSGICPGATYRYLANDGGMEIRFEGSVDTPEAGVILPLTYATLDRPAAAAP